ncbi:hypothetical protein Tco_0000598 [Tanacetum coccineum]
MVSYNHIIRKNLRLQRAANSQRLQSIPHDVFASTKEDKSFIPKSESNLKFCLIERYSRLGRFNSTLWLSFKDPAINNVNRFKVRRHDHEHVVIFISLYSEGHAGQDSMILASFMMPYCTKAGSIDKAFEEVMGADKAIQKALGPLLGSTVQLYLGLYRLTWHHPEADKKKRSGTVEAHMER